MEVQVQAQQQPNSNPNQSRAGGGGGGKTTPTGGAQTGHGQDRGQGYQQQQPYYNNNRNKPCNMKVDVLKQTLRDNEVKQISSLLVGTPEETFADFKLIVKDGTEFNVHRNILAVRSPVFKAMFSGELKESAVGEFKIDDADLKAAGMKSILGFIYSGETPKFSLRADWNDEPVGIEQLMYVASKFELADLMDFFDETLGTGFYDEEEAECLLRVTKKFELKTARKKIMDFVSIRPELCKLIIDKFI